MHKSLKQFLMILFLAVMSFSALLTCEHDSDTKYDIRNSESKTMFEGLGFFVQIDKDIDVIVNTPVEDFDIYTFKFQNKIILMAYAGNFPEYPMLSHAEEKKVKSIINDLQVECIEYRNTKSKHSKECLIHIGKGSSFPQLLHYWYSDLFQDEKERAEEIIRSTNTKKVKKIQAPIN